MLETDMKTQASRRGVPMLPELAEMLQCWRRQTPYSQDDIGSSPRHTPGASVPIGAGVGAGGSHPPSSQEGWNYEA